LWFYSNPGLTELPAFFYVLFYEEDGVGGYRVFKPYIDGPEKLLRSGGSSRAQAFRYLNGISAELAHATLTYIPGEPIDTETYTGSMHSMQVVNAVQAYANMPSYVQQIMVRRARVERVSSRIEFHEQPSNLDTFVALEDGKYWLHWRMQVNEPFQALSDKTARWEVKAKLYAQGRLVFEDGDSPSFGLPPAPAIPAGSVPKPVVSRTGAYSDRIPIERGKYQLNVVMRNLNSGAVFEASRDIECGQGADWLGLSDIVIVAKHQPQPGRRPFLFSGVLFTPSVEQQVDSAKGLPLLYQIVLQNAPGKRLAAHYVIAEASLRSRKNIDEDLKVSGADPSGALLISRTLPISELAPGHYRLSLRIEDKDTGKTAATAISFQVVNELADRNPIAIARQRADNAQSQAAEEYERALCSLAQNQTSKAVGFLSASWRLSNNPSVKNLLDHLSSGVRAEGSKDNPR
jgi:hypothetical protein